MPTGSGKTWLAEQAIASVLAQGGRAIYLTPLRALATELTLRWQHSFPDANVGVFTGDYGVAGKPFPRPLREAHLLVMTPERLDMCLRHWRTHWPWLPAVTLVVIDEIHLLGDRHRGGRLEGALSRMRRLNPFAHFLGLSATLGNIHELAAWLDGVAYVSSWRPIPLQWRLVRYQKATDKPTLLTTEVKRNVRTGGKSLVFVQSRRRAEALSRTLQDAGLHASHHHAGLSRPVRQAVEEEFRGQTIDVLVATATLEMGVNLPVRQVVLYDLQEFDGTGFHPLSTNSVWQRVGRAGRPGLDTAGEALLLVPTWDKAAAEYLHGRFEPIYSALSAPGALTEQILTEVACGLAITPTQLQTIFEQSLAASQQRLPKVTALITQMCAAGMLSSQQEGPSGGPERLKVTPLGWIAVRHYLTPSTVLLFQRVFAAYDDLRFLDLLIVAACAEDCEPVIPVDFEELDMLASALSHEPSVLLQCAWHTIQQVLPVTGKRFLTACKMALIARAWTRCADTSMVATRFECYACEVERLCESLGRLLLAIHAVVDRSREETAICNSVDAETIPLPERIRALYQMVYKGLDESMVTLTSLKGLGPQLAKRLQHAGITNIEDLALAEPHDLVTTRGISYTRAMQWIADAQTLVKTRSASCYQEHGPSMAFVPPGWPAEVDPYRLRRALELKVVCVDGGQYRVTGGLEPHSVQRRSGVLLCDCMDASRGHHCKHLMAVQIQCDDRHLRQLARQLGRSPSRETLNLFDLWFDEQTLLQRSRGR
jgi:helicase